MSVYNITGWSGGGRRPLTYNLRAGQFRNMGGCNVFGMPTRTVINNNFGGCGYNYDCGCNSGSRVPSWMQWCMGGGMVMNFLGNMMSAIFPAKESNSTEGKGATLTNDQQTDLALYKQLAKDNNCTILGPRSDGSYYLKPKGKAAIPLSSLDELKNYIDEHFTTEATDTEAEETGIEAQLKSAQKLIKDSGFDEITAEIENGKIVYKFGNEKLETLAKAIAAKAQVKQEIKPQTVAAQQTDYSNLSNITVTDKSTPAKTKDITGDTTIKWQKADENDDKTKAPQEFSVTTASGNIYTYTLNGKQNYNGIEYPKYTCTGVKLANGASKTPTAQSYILMNGQLQQFEGFDGFGTST